MKAAYRWRGKTYKTIAGLHGALRRVYGDGGLSFDERNCYLGFPDGMLRFKRTISEGVSEIADQPVLPP